MAECLSTFYHLIELAIPFECMKPVFMKQALLALILLAPMAAIIGVQVVNFRMAFFSDAISHSAFAGVAIGLIFSINPHWSMSILGVIAGIGIMAVQRNSNLSSDTVIGVFFSAVLAFGLAAISRDPLLARDMGRFLYGDILTITEDEIIWLMFMFFVVMLFQTWSYNLLFYIGINSTLAKVHRVPVAFYQYTFSGLLALIVMSSVWAVGVLLVTAMLIVPAAAARNFAHSAGTMFWWAIIVSVTSAIAGLLISAQNWARTATGATIILVASIWFMISTVASLIRKDRIT